MTKKDKSKKSKKRDKSKKKRVLSAAQKKVTNKMKEAAKLYKEYKKEHPNGKEKVSDFVKKVWKSK